jgi:serine/threonine protein kinase
MQAVGLTQGQVVGDRYKIVRRIGNGAFGYTYLAEDIHMPGVGASNLCVVKQLQPQQTDPASLEIARRLFNSEAVVLSKLGSHPQIPSLSAYFEEGQEFYLVQEYVDGHDLSHEITPGKTMSEVEVQQFLEDTLSILDFVHQNGVIHRDLKPSNIMRRSQDNALVLIDFGVVKQIGTQLAPTGQTSLTVAVGTKGYMSPELACGKPKFCSDLYSLGKIAIQALTGTAPWMLQDDPDTDEVMWRHLIEVSPALGNLIDRMVCHNYRQRYQSAYQVLADLRTIRAESLNSAVATILPAPPAAPPTSPPVTQRLISNKRWLIRTGALVAVLGGLGIWRGSEVLQLRSNLAELELLRSEGKYDECLDRTSMLMPHPQVEAIQSGCSFLQAEQLSRSGRLVEAIMAAQVVKPDHPDYGEKAQTLINESASTLLTNAKEAAESSSFQTAITTANSIPADHPLRPEADRLITESATQVVERATNRRSENLEEAIAQARVVISLADNIPSLASTAEDAGTKVESWEQELETGNAAIAEAESILESQEGNYWETADTALNDLPDTPYWRNRSQALRTQIASARPRPAVVEPVPVAAPRLPEAPLPTYTAPPPVYIPPVPPPPVVQQPPAPPPIQSEPPVTFDIPTGGGPVD